MFISLEYRESNRLLEHRHDDGGYGSHG